MSDEPSPQEDARVAELLKKEKSGFAKRQFAIIGELWSFLKVRKKWWLLPIILTLILAGALIVFGQASPLSPFIYALF